MPKDSMRNLMYVAAAIALLYFVKQWMNQKGKKEGFSSDEQNGIIAGAIILLILVAIGIGYMSYSIN